MPQKKILLDEACKFVRNNGYLLAIYKKQDDGNFHILSEAYTIEIDPMLTEIMVKTTGAATDFNEFETVDGQHCFRLHNNFNVPKIIPVFKRS
jgi:hypothetical protein